MKMKKWQIWLLTAALLAGLTGCGSRAPESVENAMPEDMKSEQSMDVPSGSHQMQENRKWIITAEVYAETEDLEELLQDLHQKVEGAEGYFETQNIHNGSSYSDYRYRSAELTVRIPADRVDDFLTDVKGISNVVSSSRQAEDVTLQYTDTESHVKALQTEESRLLELLEQAQTMEDLLTIEERLSQVRYELESYASQLRVMDNQVDYATVYLSVDEVREYTPVEEKSTWQRIGEGFMDSLSGVGRGILEVFVWILSNIPYLLVFGGLGTGAGFLIAKLRKKHKSKKHKENKNTEPQ